MSKINKLINKIVVLGDTTTLDPRLSASRTVRKQVCVLEGTLSQFFQQSTETSPRGERNSVKLDHRQTYVKDICLH